MPGQTLSTQVTADTVLVTTAETVIATLGGISTSAPGKSVRLTGLAQITSGTSTTAITLRIRRDSVSGQVVNEANAMQLETAAGSSEDHDIEATDTPAGEIFNATYVLTVQQTGAAANGAAIYAFLKAQCE